jgi:hypothetical protein
MRHQSALRRRPARWRIPLVFAVVVLASSALTPDLAGGAAGGRQAVARAAAAGPVVVVAAGDIACRQGSRVTRTTCHQAFTAALIGRLHPSVVLALGDLQYQAGTQPGFARSYGPTWGRFNSITRPIPGSHEYGTPGASGYYGYFGARATPLQPRCRAWCLGFYSYTVGSWHVVALNTDCSETTGRCVNIPREAAWLDRDLRLHHPTCTVAYMHNPLFSGGFGATPGVRPLWRVMQAHGVDLVLTGRAHNYQRFLALGAFGRRSPRGIVEIIAGTGGASIFALSPARFQAARVNHHFGVVRLALGRGHWISQFITPQGAVFDRSAGTCH